MKLTANEIAMLNLAIRGMRIANSLDTYSLDTYSGFSKAASAILEGHVDDAFTECMYNRVSAEMYNLEMNAVELEEYTNELIESDNAN